MTLWTCVAALAGLLAQAAPEPAAPAPVTLTVSLNREAYVIGEDVQAEVVLANAGGAAVDVAELVFEERSLSFEVTIDAEKARTFAYSVMRPNPHVADRLAPARVTLAPKKSLVGLFRIPTLKTGALTITAVYKGMDKELRSAPAAVQVAAQADGASRLAALIETSKGSMRIDLAPEGAPNSVANFVMLARRGFYDAMTFHRVVKNGWIQTGCPLGNGFGDPGYALKSEAKDQEALHDQGTVSMSGHLKSDAMGSQFFIALGRLPSCDKKFTVIGKLDGPSIETAKAIGAVEVDPAHDDRPREDVLLKKVSIIVVKEVAAK